MLLELKVNELEILSSKAFAFTWVPLIPTYGPIDRMETGDVDAASPAPADRTLAGGWRQTLKVTYPTADPH